MLGLDVSSWQGDIDWPRLRAARPDLRFTYVRGAGGKGGTPSAWQYRLDTTAVRNLHAARSAGLAVGAYLPFAPAASEAEEAAVEAFTYLAELDVLQPGWLVPALDVEDKTRDWSAWTADLLHWWRRLTGRVCDGRVLFYSAGSYFDTFYAGAFNRDVDDGVGVWVAHWNGTPGATPYTVGGRAVLHQYTDKGAVAGVTGNVDLDTTMPGVRLGDWMIRG